MDKLERKIQQRIHFHKAMAELDSILEYFMSDEGEEFGKMQALILKFERDILTDSPIA